MRRRDYLRAGVVLAGAGALGRPVTARETSADRESASYAPLGRLGIEGTKEVVVSDPGETAYVATSDGYATVDLSDPANPALLADRRGLLSDRENGPLEAVWDVNLSRDRLAVVAPANARDAPSGVLSVDVSDPATPAHEGFYETDFPIHNCYLEDGTCYLTGHGEERNPLVIVDLDASPPRELGRWSLPEYDDRWAEIDPSLRPLHDVWVNGETAYLAYWDAGTWMVDVSDPTAPAYLGHVSPHPVETLQTPARRERLVPPGNHHFVTTDRDGRLLGIGKESWAYRADDGYVGGPSGIDLYDVSDPSAPVRLGSIDPPPTPDPTPGGVWTTAHNFEIRNGLLYSSWYQGGVKRTDVSDPTAPELTAWWRAPDRGNFWTAQTGVATEFFVAGGIGASGADPGVWTFPDRAGTQSDAPSLTPTPTPSRETPTASATPSRTPTASPSPSPTETTATTVPGFGLSATLGAVGSAVWWVRRSLGDQDEPPVDQ